jgi:adenosine deaminase
MRERPTVRPRSEPSKTPELLKRLVDEQIPLEVCPSSNVCTGVFPTLADHCLADLLEEGAFVTINTDDPQMSSTTCRSDATPAHTGSPR